MTLAAVSKLWTKSRNSPQRDIREKVMTLGNGEDNGWEEEEIHLANCVMYEACTIETCLRTITGESSETANITAGIYTGVL